MKPPERVKICELIPITSPLRLNSGPPGVARVDRHVGLDEGHVAFVGQAAASRTDNTRGHGMVEAERRADGQHPLASLELVRRPIFTVGRPAPSTFRTATSERGSAPISSFELASIGQAHNDLVGTGHHVVVGQHIAVIGDDESGASDCASRCWPWPGAPGICGMLRSKNSRKIGGNPSSSGICAVAHVWALSAWY